jgi:hypothetical protein
LPSKVTLSLSKRTHDIKNQNPNAYEEPKKLTRLFDVQILHLGYLIKYVGFVVTLQPLEEALGDR